MIMELNDRVAAAQIVRLLGNLIDVLGNRFPGHRVGVDLLVDHLVIRTGALLVHHQNVVDWRQ